MFPKHTFGHTKPYNAHYNWFQSWPFLHYDESQDVVFCHTCVKADELDTSKNAADAFVSH